MRRRRGSGREEINLTPLLDVLFSILFIVLLAGARMEQDRVDEAKAEADGLRQELSQAQDTAEGYKMQLESMEVFEEEATVLTLRNTSGEGGHRLLISRDNDASAEVIPLGPDRLENVKARLRALVEGELDGSGAPVFVVFHCDRDAIYRREYEALTDTLSTLQRDNKEVFFKLLNREEETK